MIWAALRLEMAWWRLESRVWGFNLARSMSAWRVQFRFFGQAEPRFRPTQWRRWGAPLAIGALIGAGIAVCAAVAPAISELVAAMNGQEAVVRSSILWQFFKGLPLGLALGVLTVCCGPAANASRPSHVISALAGISLILLADSALLTIFTLIVSGNDLTGCADGCRRRLGFGSRRFAWMAEGFADLCGFSFHCPDSDGPALWGARAHSSSLETRGDCGALAGGAWTAAFLFQRTELGAASKGAGVSDDSARRGPPRQRLGLAANHAGALPQSCPVAFAGGPLGGCAIRAGRHRQSARTSSADHRSFCECQPVAYAGGHVARNRLSPPLRPNPPGVPG